MAKAPAFQFYAAEYLADEHVQLMTLEEEGIYIRLLAYCWREGSIPNDIAMLSRLCKHAPVDALKIVLPRFDPHPENPDRLIHLRLEKERKSLTDYKNKKSNAGKSGAKTRWSKADSSRMRLPSQKNGTAINLPLANDSSSSSSATATSREKKERRADKPRDPRLDHPALKAVVEVKGCYPNKDTWDLVIKVVGVAPDTERLRECWVTWRSRDYAPGNLGWLTDWYVNGIQGVRNGSNGTNRESSTERNARNLRENVEYISDLSRGSGSSDREDPIGLLAAGAR